MKKLLTILLTLVMAICLVNLNNSHTKADEGGTLYYGKNASNQWNLYTDSGCTTVYTGQEDNWSVNIDDHHLTLKNGFSYSSSSDAIVILDSTANNTIEINGNVNITANSGTAIKLPDNYAHTLTIKGVSGSSIDKLTINDENSNASAIAGTSPTGGYLSFSNLSVDIKGNTTQNLIHVYDIKVATSKVNVVNKGTGLAIRCEKLSYGSFKDDASDIYLEAHGGSGVLYTDDITGESTSAESQTAFNDKYVSVINDDINDSAYRGYLVKNNGGSDFYIIKSVNADGGAEGGATNVRFPALTSSSVIEIEYDDDAGQNKWTLKNAPAGCEISGNINNPVLTLHDGLTLVSNHSQTFLLYIKTKNGTPINNVNMKFKIEGTVNILSNYHGSDYTSLFGYNGTGTINSITFEGDGNSTLNMFTGTTSRAAQQDMSANIIAIKSGDAALTFKDGTYNIIARQAKTAGAISVGILCTSGSKGVYLDNAKVNLTAGEIDSDLIDIYLCPALNVVSNNFDINLKNNSKLTLISSVAALFLTENSYYLPSSKGYNVEYFADMKGENPVEGKYGLVNFPIPGGGGTMSFYTLYYYDDSSGTPMNLPCFRVEISGEGKVDPSPSPSKKDESCEKVIGPTWHWNNSKGICEDYGVVGTSTR